MWKNLDSKHILNKINKTSGHSFKQTKYVGFLDSWPLLNDHVGIVSVVQDWLSSWFLAEMIYLVQRPGANQVCVGCHREDKVRQKSKYDYLVLLLMTRKLMCVCVCVCINIYVQEPIKVCNSNKCVTEIQEQWTHLGMCALIFQTQKYLCWWTWAIRVL